MSLKLLSEITKRMSVLDKRIARLETLEYSSVTGGAGGIFCIETIKLTTPEPVITFPSAGTLPQDYWHLWLWYSAKCPNDTPIWGFQPFMRFNDDEEYTSYRSYKNVWKCYAGETIETSVGGDGMYTKIDLMQVAGSNDSEPYLRSGCEVNIYDYRATDMYKAVTWKGWSHGPTYSELTFDKAFKAFGGGLWNSLNAITKITIHAAGAETFAAGSVFTLMGVCPKPAE